MMQGWNRPTLILMLALLILVPLVAESWLFRRDLRQAQLNLRQAELNYQLTARYECFPLRATCNIDFDGDGRNESFVLEKIEVLPERWLTVFNETGFVPRLRLPYSITDDAARTHMAIVTESGTPHLLVYDDVILKEPLEKVYAFDGRRFSPIPPTALERDILSAMATRQMAAGTYRDRASILDYRIAKLAGYYFVLGIVIFGFAYRRAANSNAPSVYHFLRGHPGRTNPAGTGDLS